MRIPYASAFPELMAQILKAFEEHRWTDVRRFQTLGRPLRTLTRQEVETLRSIVPPLAAPA